MQAEAPGYTTTEFWTTLLTHAISAAAILLTALHVTVFNGDTLTPLVPTIALVASAIAQAVYTQSRAKVKAAVVTANAVAPDATTPAKPVDPFAIDPASLDPSPAVSGAVSS